MSEIAATTLTTDSIHVPLAQMRYDLDAAAAPWRRALAAAEAGEFDRVERRAKTSTLDHLEWGTVMLGQDMARDAQPLGRFAAWRRDFAAAPLATLLRLLSGKRPVPMPPPMDQALAGLKTTISAPMPSGTNMPPQQADLVQLTARLRALSRAAGEGAVVLDPDGLRRLVTRMRTLGDNVARRIEDRIVIAATREDRTNLKALRDDFRQWCDGRDARIHALQPLVDELVIRGSALRVAGLLQAQRFGEVSHLTAAAAGRPAPTPFFAALGKLLLGARRDIAAPLQP
jgi:hypothetical protein